MTLPRISLVTPSYNQGRYVAWTVRSVLLQRYANLEYIVMDGGSTDETVRVLRPYLPHLAHFESKKDKGQADAIHRGFARATGDILGYLNSDDLLAPGCLHYVARYFADHPEVDAIYSHRVLIDEVNRVCGYWILPEHSNHRVERCDWIPQETCFWRRSLFDRAGTINPAYRFAMDYDLFVRYMRAGRFRRVDRFLGAFRFHGDSKTFTLLDTIGEEEKAAVIRKHRITKGVATS